MMKTIAHLSFRTVPADIESEVARALRAYAGYLEMRQSQMEIDCLLRWAIRGLFLGAAFAAAGYTTLYPIPDRSASRIPHLFGPQQVHSVPRAPGFVQSAADGEEIRLLSKD